MKPLRLPLLLGLLSLPGSGADICIENTDETYATTGFQHRIETLDTDTGGNRLEVIYDGLHADYRGDVYIGDLSGSGNLEIRSMATCSLNVVHLPAVQATEFSGNLIFWNYNSGIDDEHRYNSGAVLQLTGGDMAGCIDLRTTVNTSVHPYFVVALGLSGDTTLGGLISAKSSQTTTWLYSGSLKPGTTSLAHETDFSTHIAPAAHTLTIDTDGTHTFHGSIVGELSIIKRGSGTQTFIGNPGSGNRFSVQSGTLHLENAHTEAGSLSIYRNATLTHTGQLTTDTLAMQSGTLSVTGALAAETASFSGSSTLTANSSSGTLWYFTLDGDAAPVLTLSGNAVVDTIHITYTPAEQHRGWLQLTSGSTLSSTSILANGLAAQTEQRSDGLYLYIADGGLALPRTETAELIWQGSSGTWQTGSGHAESHWSGPESNSNFQSGDTVIFNHAAEITLVGELVPEQLEVNNDSGSLELKGTGYLSGGATITKSGAGELRISTANTHSGSTILRGGTLTTAHVQALGSGTIHLQGGTLNLENAALTNTLSIEGDSTLAGAGSFRGHIELRSGSLSTATLGSASLTCTGNATLIATETLILRESIGNSSELTLRGQFDATALAERVNATMVDARGNTGGTSGFIRDAGSEAQITSGGTLNSADATILLHGERVTPDATGYISLPGTTHRDCYFINEGHSTSTAEIETAAGSSLRRIDQQGGTLLVNTPTDKLIAQGGIVRLENARLTGGLAGSARLETRGQTELGGANTHSGGTFVTSGKLRITHAQALGAGAVTVGSTTRSDAPELDLADLAVSNPLHLTSAGRLCGLGQFSGSISMDAGARVELRSGSVLHLRTGQALTLAAGGNTIHGNLHLDGGQIIFRDGPLTLQGRLSIGQASTLDLRHWQGLQPGDTLLQCSNTAIIDPAQLTLLLPESLTDCTAEVDSQTGRLLLAATDDPTGSPPLHTLNRNQLAVYQALVAATGASGELSNLRQQATSCTDEAQLRNLLNQAGGIGYAALLPAVAEGARTHLRQLRRSTGSGQRLTPGGRTSVALQAQAQSSRTRGENGYNRNAWGIRLQVEQQVSKSLALGLSLESGSADISPESGHALSETTTYLDLYATYDSRDWQFTTAAGLGLHEFDPIRQDSAAPSATSINFTAELSHSLPLSDSHGLRPYLAADVTSVTLSDFSESGGSAALQSEKQQATVADASLGLRYSARPAPGTRLHLHAAATFSAGDTAPALELHFAGAPQLPFTLQSGSASRFSGEFGAGLEHALAPATILHADAAFRLGSGQSSIDAQLGLRFYF